MRKNTLSLCMIVKDEEFFLDQCLASAKDYVDEIIIVDTGSSDATKEIAGAYTDQIFDFVWNDNFSDARNYSLAKASGDWILVLDADEVVSEEDLKTLGGLLDDSSVDAYTLVQRHYGDDSLLPGWSPVSEQTKYSKAYKGYKNNPIVRLFRNREDIRYRGAIHEVVDHHALKIRLKETAIPIHHYIDENPGRPQAARQLNYLRIIEKELEHSPSGRLYSSAGAVCLYYKKDYRQAVEYLQKAVELNHDTQKNLEGVAEAHYRLGEFKEAYDIYRGLVESNYLTPSLCSNFANLLVRGEDYPAALQVLKLALGLEGANLELRARIESNMAAVSRMIENQH